MENIEKGFRYMGQLGMFVTLLGGYSMFTVEDDPDSYSIGVPVLRFRESGLVPEAQEAIHNVEAEFGNDAVVWFFIHDCYKMKDEERKERFTYLLVTNESPDDCRKWTNSLARKMATYSGEHSVVPRTQTNHTILSTGK